MNKHIAIFGFILLYICILLYIYILLNVNKTNNMISLMKINDVEYFYKNKYYVCNNYILGKSITKVNYNINYSFVYKKYNNQYCPLFITDEDSLLYLVCVPFNANINSGLLNDPNFNSIKNKPDNLMGFITFNNNAKLNDNINNIQSILTSNIFINGVTDGKIYNNNTGTIISKKYMDTLELLQPEC